MSIPSSIGNCDQLVALDLNQDNVGGTIPPEIGQLSMIQYLNLSSNSLAGSIPSEVGNCTQITTLDLSKNHLNGTIPASLSALSNLITLSLNSNTLSCIGIGFGPSVNQCSLDGFVCNTISNPNCSWYLVDQYWQGSCIQPCPVEALPPTPPSQSVTQPPTLPPSQSFTQPPTSPPSYPLIQNNTLILNHTVVIYGNLSLVSGLIVTNNSATLNITGCVTLSGVLSLNFSSTIPPNGFIVPIIAQCFVGNNTFTDVQIEGLSSCQMALISQQINGPQLEIFISFSNSCQHSTLSTGIIVAIVVPIVVVAIIISIVVYKYQQHLHQLAQHKIQIQLKDL